MTSPMIDRLSLWWSELSFGSRHPRRRLIALVALGTLAGLGEAVTVVLVVTLASARSTGLHALGVTLPTRPALLAGLTIAVVTGLGAVYVASARLTARVGSDALRAVRTGLLDGYLRTSWSTQSGVHGGELPELVMTNAQQVAFGTQQAATGITAVLNLAVLVVAAVALSWWSVVGLAGIFGLTMLVMRPSRILVRRIASQSASSSAAVTRSVTETVSLARELRAFGATEVAMDHLGAAVDTNADDVEATQFVSRAVPAITRAATIILLVVMLAALTRHGRTSLTELGAVVLLLLRALSQAQSITTTVNTLAQRTSNLVRVRRFLDHWRAAAPTVGTLPCPSIGEIVVDAVSYRYAAPSDAADGMIDQRSEDPLALALDGVSLRIGHGEQVGVIGRTGAGKSTLAGILLGVLQPDSGSVLVDGVPLAALCPTEWFRRVGWVPQDPRLLTGTVADNIRFFRPDLDLEQLEPRRPQRRSHRESWQSGRRPSITPSAPAGSPCPAANASASPWPAPSPAPPTSSSWTSPPAPSTPRASP